MRDIKPQKQPEKGAFDPPAPDSLPKPPKLRGSKVPVSNITVPAPAKKPVQKKSSLRPATNSKTSLARTKNQPAAPKPARRSFSLGGRERIIVGILIALVAITAILGAVIFWPHAEIRLVLRTAPLLVDETLQLEAGTTSDSTVIPGTAFFREVEVSGESPVTTTEVIGARATGTVHLINRTVDEQQIKTQSRLVTEDDILFYLQGDAFIPPNGQVTVRVEAAEAGEQGNIEAQRLNFAALDEGSQQLVYAEATASLSGGSGETVPVVAAEDLDQAQEMAATTARQQVEGEIRGELPEDWVVLEESWTAEVNDFETSRQEGDRESTIPYTARVIIRVLGYEQVALENHLKNALEARVDDQYMLFPGPISYTKTIKDVDWEAASATVSTRVTHTTIPQFSLDSLKEKLAGRRETEAREYLEGLPGVRSVDLALSPFWARSIPRIEPRIDLSFIPERQP